MTADTGTAVVETAVRANYASQRNAMVSGDANALADLLTEDFVLTHMTGYVQPRAEWLADLRSGAMTYHSIHDVDVHVDVRGDSGHAPVLLARTRTNATIWASHGTWPLQLEIHFVNDGGRWLAASTIASTW